MRYAPIRATPSPALSLLRSLNRLMATQHVKIPKYTTNSTGRSSPSTPPHIAGSLPTPPYLHLPHTTLHLSVSKHPHSHRLSVAPNYAHLLRWVRRPYSLIAQSRSTLYSSIVFIHCPSHASPRCSCSASCPRFLHATTVLEFFR